MGIPIPGVKVDFNTPLVSKSVEAIKDSQANGMIRENQKVQLAKLTGQLLSPAILATMGTLNGGQSALIISGLLLLREDGGQEGLAIPNINWDVYYNVTFDLDGGMSPSDSDEEVVPNFYKLCVYIVYHQSETNPIDKFNLYNAETRLMEGSLTTSDGSIIPLKSIRTVEAIVVNTDPKTSRGTVTTVQSGG